MSYNYATERPKLFTEEGTKTLLKIRDRAKWLGKEAGAFTAGAAMRECTGDSWTMLAALDYLVETGEIVRVTERSATWGQFQVFTPPKG